MLTFSSFSLNESAIEFTGMKAFYSLCAGVLLIPAVAFAQESILASDTARTYPVVSGPLVEKTLMVEEQASALEITYSSDAPIEMRVSFFVETPKGITYNPLSTLRFKDVPVGSNQKITLDLTGSPAWSPRGKSYLFHVIGSPGTVIMIHSISHTPPSIGKTIAAAFKQIGVDEPVLLSSVNTLEGYRVLGISLSLMLGLAFIVVLIVLGIKFFTFHSSFFTLLTVSLIFLLLYDSRFSLDLLKTSARDLSEWTERGEYRQLGPIFAIADLLKGDAPSDQSMKVSVCMKLDDIYLKQLRYRLYPAPVRRSSELWTDATHLVFIGVPRTPALDGTIVCTEGQIPRKVSLLKAFVDGTAVYRFDGNP